MKTGIKEDMVISAISSISHYMVSKGKVVKESRNKIAMYRFLKRVRGAIFFKELNG